MNVEEGCLFFLLKLKLRDNPRYMAGEFLSDALQNIEDFKFEEVRFCMLKQLIISLYRPLTILRKLAMKQQEVLICPQVLKDFLDASKSKYFLMS